MFGIVLSTGQAGPSFDHVFVADFWSSSFHWTGLAKCLAEQGSFSHCLNSSFHGQAWPSIWLKKGLLLIFGIVLSTGQARPSVWVNNCLLLMFGVVLFTGQPGASFWPSFFSHFWSSFFHCTGLAKCLAEQRSVAHVWSSSFHLLLIV